MEQARIHLSVGEIVARVATALADVGYSDLATVHVVTSPGERRLYVAGKGPADENVDLVVAVDTAGAVYQVRLLAPAQDVATARLLCTLHAEVVFRAEMAQLPENDGAASDADEYLRRALSELGGNADEVAKSLRVQEVQGLRGSASEGPVAEYLRRRFASERVTVVAAHGDVLLVLYHPASVAQPAVAHVRLPAAVRDFVDAFTQGAYPDLAQARPRSS